METPAELSLIVLELGAAWPALDPEADRGGARGGGPAVIAVAQDPEEAPLAFRVRAASRIHAAQRQLSDRRARLARVVFSVSGAGSDADRKEMALALSQLCAQHGVRLSLVARNDAKPALRGSLLALAGTLCEHLGSGFDVTLTFDGEPTSERRLRAAAPAATPKAELRLRDSLAPLHKSEFHADIASSW